ncbi:glycosidase [Robinsoniella peoriensis]|uniref:glycosidase n=1 Tax=Robinsoniella peoriensis TaxID=180332 RepID=UPI00085CB361|nr:glycosidase [Robinsoniella peoriensis]
MNISANNGPMLNAYPDSMGGTLKDIAKFLEKPELKDVFKSFYILPSLFNTDLDRGFSVIDYTLNDILATREDLNGFEQLGVDLKLDFILNHASVLSSQFQDIIKNGEKSKYKDFFINWNKFWEGHGTMTEEGYIQPDSEMIEHMFFRKPGLPILMVRFPDGKNVPYWNTFYQEVKYPVLNAQDIMQVEGLQYATSEKIAELMNRGLADGKKPAEILLEDFAIKISAEQKAAIVEKLESCKKYLGQMDLNIKSPLVWEFYDETLKTLSSYGAKIVRLDAFAYAPKEPGKKNFLNEPGTWEVLEKVRQLADKYKLTLLPEIHASYSEKNYEMISQKGYITYDFFLPGLVIDALERGCGDVLTKWANELIEKEIHVVNMLGCHDGIPLLDLKGLIPEERIQSIIDTVVARGGFVKDLHGQKNVYYQVNATYYSALGESDTKMLLARALQLFMPGKPQVWYLDLFAGKNDHEAVKRAGAGGHKEINRSNLSVDQMEEKIKESVVKKQFEMLRFRATFPAFAFDSNITVDRSGSVMNFVWKKNRYTATLSADLANNTFSMKGIDPNGVESVIV